MKIGIIIYSQTENTYSVSLKFKEQLMKLGHTVDIERVEPIDSKERNIEKITFKSLPDTDKYDALTFGAPVHGFALAPVMAAYINQMSSLKNKKIVCFATMFFPFNWMGGTNAISRMKNLCKLKGGTVLETGIVNWSSKKREQKISKVIESLSKVF